MREEIAAAGGLLISTPEYNHSIPGQLKNALDWASRPHPRSCLRGLPVVVVSASTSRYGGIWAQQEVRKVLGASGARVLEPGLALATAESAFDAGGRLVSPTRVERLAECLRALEAEGSLRPALAA